MRQAESDRVSVPCDLCGSEDVLVLFVKEGYPHVRCTRCGLVYVTPRPASHLETQRSGGTGSMGEERLSPRQIRRLQKELALLEPFRKSNRMLEIGPGKGWFLQQAAHNGWETWAVEINRDALGHLRSKGIGTVIEEPAESFHAPTESFDVIRMWDVIEHLRSPGQAVAAITNALRPGGLLRLATTNFASLSRWVNGPEWVYFNGADHIYLFEPKTITRLLEQHGFTEIRIRTRGFNMRRKLYHPEQEVPPVRRYLLPFRKLLDEAMRFTRFGHQMIVTGVKGALASN